MNTNKKGINTICTHEGELEDKLFKGAVSPLYMSTSHVLGGTVNNDIDT